MTNIHFLHKHILWLLLLLPILVLVWYKIKNKQKVVLLLSSIQSFKKNKTLLEKLQVLLPVFRFLALGFLILALARPQSVESYSKTLSTNGIDIVLAMDVSGSMLSRDLKPNRLEAIKNVASKFVSQRPNDRLGLVVYAAEAYTKSPITSDKNVLLNAISSVTYDGMLQDGTGIGVGLGTAINRLKSSKAKSKVVILMTDGVNNSGLIDPMMAASMAKKYKIKVYTIGVGSNGMADTPYGFSSNGEVLYKKMKVEIDENLMKNIAKETLGNYFRATDTKKLQEIYQQINRLEKSKIDEQKFMQRTELFRYFAVVALILIALEFILRKTLFKGIV